MLVNNQSLDFIFYQADLRFQATYLKTPTHWQEFASEVPSGTRENRYGWIGRLPQVREWLGDRVMNNVASREYTIVNKLWEDSLRLPRVDIQDDQLGLFNMSVEMLAMQAKVFPDRLLTTLLTNGSSATLGVCFDGQPFFSASHPVNVDVSGGTTYSNYSANGLALTFANYQTVRTTMMAYVGEDGNPFGVIPDLLMVPPALEAAGKQILEAELVAHGAVVGANAASTVQSSITRGTAKLLVNPYLAAAVNGSDTTWYLMSTQFPIRPFLYQVREPVKFTYKNNSADESVWKRNDFEYGVDFRSNAGYTLPFLCYRATA